MRPGRTPSSSPRRSRRGPETLGDRAAWQAEWKWDGIRGQLIRREGHVFLWSRGEELITERFPEVVEAGETLPDGTVLDGEVLAHGEDRPLPFALLQTRIGRQTLTPKILAQAPAAFMAYDLLEHEGQDLRERPLSERRARLEALLAGRHRRFFLSEVLGDPSWDALAERRLEARERKVEGLMLKRLDSPYRTGRRRGDWWKWKIDPFQVDAVLLYAHPGNGRRANLFTDYTFAVWDEGTLVPVAKAYSGLSDAEIRELDGWVRAHTAPALRAGARGRAQRRSSSCTSRASPAPRGTSPASRSASPASPAGAPTSRRARRTRWTPSSG